jgi:large subunit ribosomal protein L10
MGINVRELIIRDYESTFRDVPAFVLVDHSGYTAEATKKLRKSLKEQGLRMKVVRNNLAQRAFEKLGNDLIGKALIGPISIIHGEDGLLVSKAVADWNRSNRPLPIKGGYILGAEHLLSARDVIDLSKLPDKDTMRSIVLGTFIAPIRNIANCFQASLAGFVQCVQAHVRKLEGESGAAAPETDESQSS